FRLPIGPAECCQFPVAAILTYPIRDYRLLQERRIALRHIKDHSYLILVQLEEESCRWVFRLVVGHHAPLWKGIKIINREQWIHVSIVTNGCRCYTLGRNR